MKIFNEWRAYRRKTPYNAGNMKELEKYVNLVISEFLNKFIPIGSKVEFNPIQEDCYCFMKKLKGEFLPEKIFGEVIGYSVDHNYGNMSVRIEDLKKNIYLLDIEKDSLNVI